MSASFWDYWLGLIRTNSSLADESVRMTISVKSFKKQLEKAWEDGRKSVRADPIEESLDKIFGRFR